MFLRHYCFLRSPGWDSERRTPIGASLREKCVSIKEAVELNIAVLYSFAKHGVTIVDHHTASRQFLLHEQQEKQAGRAIPAHWAWLVPPISGSASPLFHNPSYKNSKLKPNFFYQPAPWQEH